MKRYLIWVVGLAMFVGEISMAMAQDKPAAKAERPRIEVAFVLDTTGSMGGLIQGAKEKVWAIANTLATAKPAPEIRMGLIAYRDRGDQYTTRITNLSDDLDAVYKALMEFQADGGGDTPESVNQALNEAVTKMSWSKDAKTLKIVYLVGDCPPHMDYKDDVKYPDTCKAAAAAGIIVNTIQCGDYAGTAQVWKDIASRAEGAYFAVAQSGGAVAVATPFDKELAELSAALDGTRIGYGSKEEREAMKERAKASEEVRAAAPAAAAADRAEFVAGEAGARTFAGGKELVTDVSEGKVKLEQVDEKALPDELKKMTPEERAKYVQAQVDKRKQIQENIKKLSAKRREYVEAEMKKTGADKKDSFDKAILESVKTQAEKKGIAYEKTE